MRPPLPPRPPLPLLITGIPGVPGYNALHYFQGKYPGQVYRHPPGRQRAIGWAGHPGLQRRGPVRDGAALRPLPLRRRAGLRGQLRLKACELNPELARRINVDGVANLLAQTVPRGLRLVHLSVDLVFSGLRDGGYVEDDPIDPVTVYGKTMAEGEQLLRESDPAACILRISLPMGVSFNGHAGAIDWITSRFRKSRPATLYFDEIRTPTYTDCMNQLYELLLRQRPGRRFSCRRAAAIDALPDRPDHQPRRRLRSGDFCMASRGSQAGPIPPRAGNVAMDSGKLVPRPGLQSLRSLAVGRAVGADGSAVAL